MHACMRACMHVHKCVHLIRMVPADGSCYQEYGCFLLSMGCMVSYSELSASIHACMCISACTSCIRTCKCNFFTMVPAGTSYIYSCIYSVFFNNLQRLPSKCCLHNHYNIQTYTLNDLEHTFTPKYHFGAYIDS